MRPRIASKWSFSPYDWPAQALLGTLEGCCFARYDCASLGRLRRPLSCIEANVALRPIEAERQDVVSQSKQISSLAPLPSGVQHENRTFHTRSITAPIAMPNALLRSSVTLLELVAGTDLGNVWICLSSLKRSSSAPYTVRSVALKRREDTPNWHRNAVRYGRYACCVNCSNVWATAANSQSHCTGLCWSDSHIHKRLNSLQVVKDRGRYPTFGEPSANHEIELTIVCTSSSAFWLPVAPL